MQSLILFDISMLAYYQLQKPKTCGFTIHHLERNHICIKSKTAAQNAIHNVSLSCKQTFR